MNTAKFLNWTVVFDKITNLSKIILFQKIEDVINSLFMHLLWARFLFILPSNRVFFLVFLHTHTVFLFTHASSISLFPFPLKPFYTQYSLYSLFYIQIACILFSLQPFTPPLKGCIHSFLRSLSNFLAVNTHTLINTNINKLEISG